MMQQYGGCTLTGLIFSLQGVTLFIQGNGCRRTFENCGIKNNSSHATAYELRHHYAIENINRWTDEGFGFDAKLLYLSKSMGHSTLESTRYYYSLVPGMAEILEEKTGGDFENIVPEVDYEASDE